MLEEKDPDDLIRERGADAFRNILTGALPIWEVLWARETANVNVKIPDNQAVLEQKLTKLIRAIKDPLVQTAYIRMCRLQLANLFWKAGQRNRDNPSKLVRDHLRTSGEGERVGIQKVLLGMLVNYPTFLERKEHKISTLHFESDLEKFCGALYLLLVEYGSLEVHDVYRYLPKEFYNNLDDIHGFSSDGKRLGHSLFARFPVLDRDPPLDFVERCIDHFIAIIHYYEVKADIVRAESEAGASGDTDDAMNRLVQLVRLRESLWLEISAESLALTEEAEAITRLWSIGRTRFPSLPLAA
jgi:DNA primase